MSLEKNTLYNDKLKYKDKFNFDMINKSNKMY